MGLKLLYLGSMEERYDVVLLNPLMCFVLHVEFSKWTCIAQKYELMQYLPLNLFVYDIFN